MILIKVELVREDGTIIVRNIHGLSVKHGGALWTAPVEGHIVDGDEIIYGYSIKTLGRIIEKYK